MSFALSIAMRSSTCSEIDFCTSSCAPLRFAAASASTAFVSSPIWARRAFLASMFALVRSISRCASSTRRCRPVRCSTASSFCCSAPVSERTSARRAWCRAVCRAQAKRCHFQYMRLRRTRKARRDAMSASFVRRRSRRRVCRTCIQRLKYSDIIERSMTPPTAIARDTAPLPSWRRRLLPAQAEKKPCSMHRSTATLSASAIWRRFALRLRSAWKLTHRARALLATPRFVASHKAEARSRAARRWRISR
mmetsp:Transcript_12434/g.38693  ORF Transcript_12434/g.38693 Transcript_12434/m.38693 type:complete len:250 (+) Transcript_12434:465-1214(+)